MTLRRSVALFVVLAAAFLTIYLPALGHGLIKDDFGWIQQSALHRPGDALLLFLDARSGFYRPLVALSFGIDTCFFGIGPRGYALTNLALVLATAGMLSVLVRRTGLPMGAAILAAALWAFNMHGISMALLWTSGRTALLLTLFAVCAAAALRRGGRWSVAAWALAAMWSKETAVLLPVILWWWASIWPRDEAGSRAPSAASALRAGWRQAWPAFVSLGVYLALRSRTGAMTPFNAPPYYRFDFAPVHVAANVFQYADRACTWPAAILLLLVLAIRRRPALDPVERRAMLAGLCWLVSGYAITIFLPVRSSLYACFPSVGAALIAAAAATALWREARPALRPRLVTAGLLLPFALWPVYHARNARWVTPADRSRQVLAQIGRWTDRLPAGSTIVVNDEEQGRVSVASVFGTLLPIAVDLTAGKDLTVLVHAAGAGRRTWDVGRDPATLYLTIARDGHVRRSPDSCRWAPGYLCIELARSGIKWSDSLIPGPGSTKIRPDRSDFAARVAGPRTARSERRSASVAE